MDSLKILMHACCTSLKIRQLQGQLIFFPCRLLIQKKRHARQQLQRLWQLLRGIPLNGRV